MKVLIVVFLGLILLAALGAGCLAPAEQGTLIVAVKDAPPSTIYGPVSSLNLTITEVSVHRAGPGETPSTSEEAVNATESTDTSTTGWITVIDQPRTVDLLQLTNETHVLGQKTLDVGIYTQIRLVIGSGSVTVDGHEYPLTVPSGVLKLNRGFVLETNETLQLTLDFDPEKSVIETGAGSFKLQPVIAVISENVTGFSDLELACRNSGGTITAALCCKSVRDFPDLCLIGACGCSPDNSHTVKICECGPDRCFDGTICVPR